MADNITSTSVITPAVNAYFQKLLLVRNKPKLIHALFADRYDLPSGQGKTAKWRRWAALPTRTAEVSEGITPDADRLSKQDISATVAQYIGWVMITDVLEFTCENKILNIAVSELNDQMHRTEDELVRNILVTSASATTASKGTPAPTNLNADDLEIVANTLQNVDASPVAPQINASVKVSTAGVESSFWAMMHTQLKRDFRRCEGFIKPVEYGHQGGILEAEIGNVSEVRGLASSVAHKQGSATEAFPASAGEYYYIPVIAKHGYGVVDLKKANASLIIHPKGSGGSSDPADQRQTAAWKFMNVCRILNDNNIHILKVTLRAD
ncbi:MAG: N4-gp56 family major capsid protein [Desulfobacterales bacterium]|nr:N4-gp56 family major capsid protein [Desulfobacterales bacterium]